MEKGHTTGAQVRSLPKRLRAIIRGKESSMTTNSLKYY